MLIICLILLTGCKPKSLSPKSTQQITKENVSEYLKSEDGKDLLADILTQEDVKEELFIHAKTTKKVIEELISAEKQKKMWEELFKDHDFQNIFAQSMEDEHRKLLEKLVKDPDFQQNIIEMLDDPEVTEQVIQAMKSHKFRSYLSDIIKETLESPSMSKKLQEAMENIGDKSSQQGPGNQQENSSQEQMNDAGGI